MRHKWTESETELLINLFPDVSTKKIAELLNMSYMQVSQKAYALRLRKSEAYMQTADCGRIMKGQRVGKGTEFRKGLVPFNKGKKQVEFMTAESIERTKATRFRKGNIPQNWKPIGSERITKDGYIEVKVRDADENAKNKNYELKHRVVWEQHNGQIPEGMIVGFTDGDKMNCSIDNLVLRTQKENMLRNTFSDNTVVKRFLKIKNPDMVEKVKKEMPELITATRMTLKLTQQINKHGGKTD